MQADRHAKELLIADPQPDLFKLLLLLLDHEQCLVGQDEQAIVAPAVLVVAYDWTRKDKHVCANDLIDGFFYHSLLMYYGYC